MNVLHVFSTSLRVLCPSPLTVHRVALLLRLAIGEDATSASALRAAADIGRTPVKWTAEEVQKKTPPAAGRTINLPAFAPIELGLY